jgi:glutathione S-transferase
VYEWLFFEQYSHEPAVAVRRSILTIPERAAQATPERLAQLLEAGERALGVMEQRLSKADWLAGEGYSVADIALYALRTIPGRAASISASIPASAPG